MKEATHFPIVRMSLRTIAIALVASVSSFATTVIPPSFDELVSRAQIFEGTVSNVRSEWEGEGAQRRIDTYVTFKVEDAIKGNAGPVVTLRMLGGTVGDQTMEVSDGPKFKPGDHDILFVENNGSQFIPLVGIMHGRFRVRKEASGRDVIHTSVDEPVAKTGELGNESVSTLSAAQQERPMTLQQFKQAVRAKIGQLSPQP
jgi:hypothetical protein